MIRKLTLIPVEGKYVNVSFEGKEYEVWRVNPQTNQPGTEIERTLALDLLAIQPPVVSILPVIDKGKNITQLSLNEIEYIKARRVQGVKATGVEAPEQAELKQELEAQKQKTAELEKMLAENQALLKKLVAEKGKN